MSDQSINGFKQRMDSDQAFRDGILGEASIEGRMRMAQAAGFDCTADEVMSAAGLSDDQLDGVTGGLAPSNTLFNQSTGSFVVDSAPTVVMTHHIL